MTDLLVLQRINEIMRALDKMHNGLVAMIDAHHKLEKELDERIKQLEEPTMLVCSDCGHRQGHRKRCDRCFGPMVTPAEKPAG